jgi:hypothetical protein
MIRRLFTVVCAVALVPCLALLFAAVYSYFGNVRWAVQLPGGIEAGIHGKDGRARAGFTRWGVESDQWWKNRPKGAAMRVSGETIVLGEGSAVRYATRVHVDMGGGSWRGVQWREGAMSKEPMTQSRGVLSTPLVPFRSVSLPWYYLFVPLSILPGAWAIGWWRRRELRKPGCCKVCGYDMRATPGRCPECGTRVTPPESPTQERRQRSIGFFASVLNGKATLRPLPADS